MRLVKTAAVLAIASSAAFCGVAIAQTQPSTNPSAPTPATPNLAAPGVGTATGTNGSATTGMSMPNSSTPGDSTSATGTAVPGTTAGNTAASRRASSKTLAPGSNSFTHSQAAARISKAGYTDVSGLKKDSRGVWRGTAQKDGNTVKVGLDYRGNVISH